MLIIIFCLSLPPILVESVEIGHGPLVEAAFWQNLGLCIWSLYIWATCLETLSLLKRLDYSIKIMS